MTGEIDPTAESLTAESLNPSSWDPYSRTWWVTSRKSWRKSEGEGEGVGEGGSWEVERKCEAGNHGNQERGDVEIIFNEFNAIRSRYIM